MKGTEKIIAHIRSDAQAQCDAILAAAQEKIDAIRADYDAQAAEAYAERIRAGVKSCADEGESAARLARMEAKKTLLALKQAMISRSFDEAAKKLAALPEEHVHAADSLSQISFADLQADEIRETLRKTDLNTLTPLEALNLLYTLQRKAMQ